MRVNKAREVKVETEWVFFIELIHYFFGVRGDFPLIFLPNFLPVHDGRQSDSHYHVIPPRQANPADPRPHPKSTGQFSSPELPAMDFCGITGI